MAKLLNDDREKPIYSSTRFSDVLIYAEVKDFLRVLFDDEKKLFIYCDGWDYIHIFLGKAALDYGLYPQDMSSKLSKNLGLFEFAISNDYQERLLNQDSYSKVTEYNGFYIYTREGSELLKNSVFRDIVKPYKKSKEITIEERIKKLEKKLDESVKPVNKELADTKLITSAHELNEYLKNHTASRFVYDTEKNWFLVGNAENSIHIELLNDALIDGVYPPFEWNGNMLPNDNHYEAEGGKVLYNLHPSRFLLFRTSADPNDFMEFTDDRYNNCYYYPDYCVFDRSNEFKETPLYKLLGKPEYIEHWNGEEFEQLNEELVYAERDADGNLENEVFKNPSKAEIRKNYLSQTRVVIDGEGNFYFCMAGNLIHDDIIEKIGKGENYSLFYDYYKDTFYKRDEYRNKEEHERMNKRLREWLLSYPYIRNNFGIDFNAYVFMNIEEPFDIKIEELNEDVNLHKNNRVAGFFYYKDNKWELLPRTEEIFDMDDDWDKYLKFQHNAPEGWLEEANAIRFSIETHDDDKTLCVIESPKELWVKPFIKRLYNKFPEEMSMVDLFDVEYQDIYDQTHWKQFSPLDLD